MKPQATRNSDLRARKIKEFAMGALMFTGMAGVIGYAVSGLLGLI
jgi:hypothetical protein